jgi:cytochrome c556
MAQPARLLFVFVAMVALARPANAQADPSAQPTPVLDNVDLMDLMVKPAYDELQRALARPPEDRRAWAALYQKAARLAEIENLLYFRTRAEAARKSEWGANAARAQNASADLAAAALLGLRNASAADFDAVRGRLPAVAGACTACHRAFARDAPAIKP